jgi:seryl-tRNA synthetase
MIDMNDFRARPDAYREAARVKRIGDCDVDSVLELDAQRRQLLAQVEALRAERNVAARAKDRTVGRAVAERLRLLEAELREVQQAFDRAVLFVPSIAADDVPIGGTDEDNVVVRVVGEPPTFDFAAMRDHMEIAAMHDWIVADDRVRAFAGARAYALVGELALLEIAVLRFALDFVVARGFTPVAPPLMVRTEAMTGTGYFPVGEENAYAVERDGLYLVGTAEVPLAALQAGRTFNATELPLRVAGMTPCFRREAGAAGRDTRGLYRVHQFQKVEQVVVCENDPDVVAALHNELLANAEDLLAALELPYRVVAVCTGELGLGQIRKHDIETWMPSRGAYGETHSCSTLGEFQTRRLNIRYRDTAGGGAKRFACTLNNTALATPRVLIPLLECHQRANGTVYVPPVLRPYLGGREVLGG